MPEENILFDSNRSPVEDILHAIRRSGREHKNILIELGADWCIWCHRLESFITTHPDLLYMRSMNFVHVRIHLPENEPPAEVLRRLPPFEGIPHFFVYNANGELLHSQDTTIFELGESYDYEKVAEFFLTWGHIPDHPFAANRLM